MRHFLCAFMPFLMVASCSADTGDFVTLPAADGHDSQHVYVVAAKNCPGRAARRADQLARDLGAAGIPAVRTHAVDFSQLRAQAQTGHVPASMIEEARRINGVMKGSLPIVFVRGRAKNNPTIKEVITEYQRTAR